RAAVRHQDRGLLGSVQPVGTQGIPGDVHVGVSKAAPPAVPAGDGRAAVASPALDPPAFPGGGTGVRGVARAGRLVASRSDARSEAGPALDWEAAITVRRG